MLKHLWSIAVQKAIIDQGKNTISLIDVVEDITFGYTPGPEFMEGAPTLLPFHHEIVSQWSKDEGEEVNFRIEVEFIDPNDKMLGMLKNEASIPAGFRNGRTITRVDQIPTTKTGRYEFRLYTVVNGEAKRHHVATIPINIRVDRNPEPPFTSPK